MNRVVIECLGVPTEKGDEAAKDIERAFQEHRRHHQNVGCSFKDGRLILCAENDFDPEGLALLDEFSDEISANVVSSFDGDLRVVSITAH